MCTFSNSEFLCKPSFTMVSPPLKGGDGGGGLDGKFMRRGCCTWGKLMIKSRQRRGRFINASSNNLNTVIFFSQRCWDVRLKIKP